MKINKSPWIHELDKERKENILNSNLEADIVIIGAGIAGISTAFYLLKNTDRKVIILEKGKLAHGATGHNAGQVVSYFERPYKELVAEFGLKATADAQRAIDNSWDHLSEMYTEAGLDIPFSRFIGYNGYSTFEQLQTVLEESKIRQESGLEPYDCLVSETANFLKEIDSVYKDLYKIVPHKEILEKLETENTDYLAVDSGYKGTINSALFCQEIYRYLQNKYSDRFKLYEHANVKKIVLHDGNGSIDLDRFEISAKKIILCTNGFEGLSIFSNGSTKIDTNFHYSVTGVVARMSGYLEKMNKQPAAFSYYVPEEGNKFDNMDEAYFYLTRRPYEYEKTEKHNLICIGGPQHSIADREEYLYEYEYPDEVPPEIDNFVKKTYDTDPNKKIEYKFTWHGLMGYTSDRVRLIGVEPLNPVLMYNLGCNGIGILPSIFGGKRLSDIIAGKPVEPMIFDPKLT